MVCVIKLVSVIRVCQAHAVTDQAAPRPPTAARRREES